jgi:hypothetical protein
MRVRGPRLGGARGPISTYSSPKNSGERLCSPRHRCPSKRCGRSSCPRWPPSPAGVVTSRVCWITITRTTTVRYQKSGRVTPGTCNCITTAKFVDGIIAAAASIVLVAVRQIRKCRFTFDHNATKRTTACAAPSYIDHVITAWQRCGLIPNR